jgi:hypothetical protein
MHFHLIHLKNLNPILMVNYFEIQFNHSVIQVHQKYSSLSFLKIYLHFSIYVFHINFVQTRNSLTNLSYLILKKYFSNSFILLTYIIIVKAKNISHSNLQLLIIILTIFSLIEFLFPM